MGASESNMFQGKEESTAVKKYWQLIEIKDKPFDMSADTEKRKLECEEVCGGGENDYHLCQQEKEM